MSREMPPRQPNARHEQRDLAEHIGYELGHRQARGYERPSEGRVLRSRRFGRHGDIHNTRPCIGDGPDRSRTGHHVSRTDEREPLRSLLRHRDRSGQDRNRSTISREVFHGARCSDELQGSAPEPAIRARAGECTSSCRPRGPTGTNPVSTRSRKSSSLPRRHRHRLWECSQAHWVQHCLPSSPRWLRSVRHRCTLLLPETLGHAAPAQSRVRLQGT